MFALRLSRRIVFRTRRFNSSQVQPPQQSSLLSHVAAGAMGGTVVLTGIYLLYHFSDIKRLSDHAQRITTHFEPPSKRSEKKKTYIALEHLRTLTKGYVAIVPGASVLVDMGFDSMADVIDEHAPEANKIISQASRVIAAILAQKKGGSGSGSGGQQTDMQTGLLVADVLKRCIIELHALGMKAGGKTFGPLWSSMADTRENAAKGIDELTRSLATHGSVASKFLSDAQQQVASAVENSGVVGHLNRILYPLSHKEKLSSSGDTDEPILLGDVQKGTRSQESS